MNGSYISESVSNGAESERLSAAHSAAARARKLCAEATTPRLKQYLWEMIAKCEGLARKLQAESNDSLSTP
jgi:hypothetical protein